MAYVFFCNDISTMLILWSSYYIVDLIFYNMISIGDLLESSKTSHNDHYKDNCMEMLNSVIWLYSQESR